MQEGLNRTGIVGDSISWLISTIHCWPEPIGIGKVTGEMVRMADRTTEMVHESEDLETLVGGLPFPLEDGVRETLSWLASHEVVW